MRILHLTVKKRRFDDIMSGLKKHEYRIYNPSWIKRLLDENGIGKEFDIVRFKNGYGSVPTMDVEFKRIFLTMRRWNAEEGGGESGSLKTIVIELGDVLRVENANGKIE